MQLYTPEGWVWVSSIREEARASGLPFVVIFGARGTGKTFGFIDELRLQHPTTFLYMRRTQVQVDLINSPDLTPFKDLDAKRGCLTAIKKINRYIGGVYQAELVDGVKTAVGQPLGYTVALASVHNIRGYNMPIDELVLDEFCPEKGERPIPDEFDVFRNAYETLNRNRELEGRPPIQTWLLSNSNMLGNAYFIGLRIVEIVDWMKREKICVRKIPERGLMIINLEASPISQKKSQTALYKLTGEDQFTKMALHNEFSREARSKTGRLPLRELLPVVQLGELQIYQHKSRRQWYGSCHRSGAPEIFGTDDASLARFRAKYGWLWEAYIDDLIIWDSYLPELLFRKFFGENY